MEQLQTTNSHADGQSFLTDVLAADPKTEGWTWHQGGRKWHYYREKRAICGGMLLLVHPSEGYELGSDNSPDNCAACKRRRLVEAANAPPPA